jgi:hypothetical protein
VGVYSSIGEWVRREIPPRPPAGSAAAVTPTFLRTPPGPHGGRIANPFITGGTSGSSGGGVNQSTQPASGISGARINWLGLVILAVVLWWLLRKGKG